MRTLMNVIFIVLLECAVEWFLLIGIVKLITICFSLNFNLLYVTGVYLIFVLIRALIRSIFKER